MAGCIQANAEGRSVVNYVKKFAHLCVSQPVAAWHLAVALLRGAAYVGYYRLFRRSVRIALPFFVYERISIRGPGDVTIAPFCSVYPNLFRGLSILTLKAEAKVRIGQSCDLGGLTIRCRERITLGERCLVGCATIQDVLMCDGSAEHRQRSDHGESDSIEIEDDVWLGGGSIVLAGSFIGKGAVVSWGGTCFRFNVTAGHIASGNPALRTLSIKSALQWARG